MRDFLTVFRYTFLEHLRKKSFIISTAILLVIAVAVMLLPSMISTLQSGGGGADEPGEGEAAGVLYVLDEGGLLGGALDGIRAASPGYDVKEAVPAEKDALAGRIAEEDGLYLLVITLSDGKPTVDYYFKEYASGPSPDALSAAVKARYEDVLLEGAGVSRDVIEKLRAPVAMSLHEQGKGYLQSTVSSIVVAMLLFLSVYYYGYWIAQSVASEKTSRVMELLITSVKPSSIIIGKTVAMGTLGLLQLSSLLLVGGITYKLAFPKDFAIMGQSLNLSGFTPFSLVMILVYFVLGYALFAMLNAVAGATVSRAEDINTAIMPISMIGLASFYFAYMTSLIPGAGDLSAASSIVPFSAPFSMPGWIMTDTVPAAEIVLSILLMAATIALLAWASVKLYSSAVLHYGKRLKIYELIGMASKNRN